MTEGEMSIELRWTVHRRLDFENSWTTVLLQAENFLSKIWVTRSFLKPEVFGFGNSCIYIVSSLGDKIQMQT